MKNNTFIYAVLGAALFTSTLTGCGDDGNESADSTTVDPPGTSGEPTGTTTDDTPTTTTNTPTNDPTNTPTNDPTNDPTNTPTNDPTAPTTTNDPETTGTTGDDPGYAFADDPPENYTQIDRHGAVEAGTAGIGAKEGLGLMPGQDVTIRDAYNASNPVEDRTDKWVPEIAKSVMFFHAALDDDLMTLKFVPASFEETVAQAKPVIVPDTIKYDPTKPTSYPNGRKLEDQVVDITLAAVLLKLGGNQPLDILAKLPLNPPKNDVEFLAEFPYLAPPHPAP